MRVLADFHHQALYHSLHLLFEERLGWELYRPIGPEWAHEGYWHVYPHPNTIRQFLGLHQGTEVPRDIHGDPLPETERKNLHYTIEDGIYYVKDLTFKTIHRAIQLEKFKNMEFDILLSSIPKHIGPYNELIRLYQPKAKHVFQIGNRWKSQPGVENIMASTAPFSTSCNAVFYHQEFDLNTFSYEVPEFHNIIHSYVHYMRKPKHLQKVAAQLPGWEGVSYGAGMTTNLHGAQAVADAMKRSAFTWHYKPGGDGFGHVIYSSYACGRPAIIWGSQYQGCGASKLFIHGDTCIDYEKLSGDAELVQKLQQYSEPKRHAQMCKRAYQRFYEIVDFNAEAEQIKSFLTNLR